VKRRNFLIEKFYDFMIDYFEIKPSVCR